jgi:hypothetical protein
MSNGDINPDPVSSEIEVAVGLLNSPKVSVYMPFNIELDELTAELFGQAVDLSGTVIKVNDPIPLIDLYDVSESAGWLHFLQAADEDEFSVYVNQAKAADLSGALATALYISEGESYDPNNKGVAHLDASGAFGSTVGEAWYNYNSLQDFLMGYFARKILGHPGALAAISNDSTLRAAYTAKYHAGMSAIYGGVGAAFADVPADLDVSGVATALTGVSVPMNGLTSADLELIVQQMMNQAPDRFTAGDRGTLCPVRWAEDDKIYVQLYLKDNKYKLNTGSPSGAAHPVLLNATNATGAIGGGVETAIENDYYVLEFTVGA